MYELSNPLRPTATMDGVGGMEVDEGDSVLILRVVESSTAVEKRK